MIKLKEECNNINIGFGFIFFELEHEIPLFRKYLKAK